MTSEYFSGSYPASDVRFLLKPIAVANTPVGIKEALIQSGQKHYSEMLTHENPPDEAYLGLFHQALADNKTLMAMDIMRLAERIVASRPRDITLVSLARAGTPIGVLLNRVLKKHFHTTADHYSISIIRDIGIDENALLHILKSHAADSIVFIDGWTGKGVIARQLTISLREFKEKHRIEIRPELYVLADLSGMASVSASSEDYLIPSSILNATVSGLISRSVIDRSQLSASDFHGCLFYEKFAKADLSLLFIETLIAEIDKLAENPSDLPPANQTVGDRQVKSMLRERSERFLDWIGQDYRISNHNLIKPGIGEATRAILRREADLLLIKQQNDPAIKHLIFLAESKNIRMQCISHLPYRAVALINEQR